MRTTIGVSAMIFLMLCPVLAVAAAPRPTPSEACVGLTGKEIGGATIASAEMHTGESSWNSPPGFLKSGVSISDPFCRVVAEIKSRIGVEVWLPTPQRWNKRLLGVGVGGSAGTFHYPLLKRGLEQGFASVSTDAGHTLTNTRWMLDPVAADDYAHLAVHLAADAAKAVVRDYYHRPSKFSYFEGCSGGGREALKELQHYPDDYDGILAGAPGPNMPKLSVRHMLAGLWQQQTGVDVTNDDWNLVQSHAIAVCDANDGLRDGVVEDPRTCHVKVSDMACTGGSSANCIPENRLALVQRIIDPIQDASGNFVVDGLLPGVRSRPGPPPALVMELFGQGVHHDDHWDANRFDVDSDLQAAYVAFPELRADDPKVGPFARHGGKLIIYQGWLDPSVIAQQTTAYFDSLVAAQGGPSQAARFARLYMVPGMYHCGGGDSTDRFGGEAGSYSANQGNDLLAALVAWRELGRSPGRVVAAKIVDGRTVRTRPLCPYPFQSRYGGSGDPSDAKNFICESSVKNPGMRAP